MMSELVLIDSHSHLHDSEFYAEADLRERVYNRAIEAGVGMVCVGTDERSSREAVEFARGRAHTWTAIGVHPHDSKNGWGEIERLLKEDHASSSIVAIGEIGLDYFYDNSPRQTQIKALEEQLQLAIDHNLPVSFHVREAFDDFWPVLNNFSGVRGVLHSFTDSQENLDKGLQRGLYIGLNGISTFTKDERQQEMYKKIPLEKILFETDAPFLTPCPFRGKMNEPGYVKLVAEYWANKRNLPIEDISAASIANTRTLFGV